MPQKLQWCVLLLASIAYYLLSGNGILILYPVLTCLTAWLCTRQIGKAQEQSVKRIWMIAAVCLLIGTLVVLKYVNFGINTINGMAYLFGGGQVVSGFHFLIPLGISFYTFQILSYVIDVYRGDVPAQRNFIDLAMYVAMFPQLIAGPIVRYSDIAGSLKNRRTSLADASEGITRFSVGLAKKILLANQAALIVSEFKASGEKTVLFYWLYTVSYMLHIYFDFSGYSDMAIGLGRIFGFRFSENFNYPYISSSITEFWRRWHISLGGWFRDYLYIPLGGNRVKPLRHVFNILVVWAATGFWHGAAWNFVLWGLLFAVLLTIEKLWLLPFLTE